jgi:cell division protein FtsB
MSEDRNLDEKLDEVFERTTGKIIKLIEENKKLKEENQKLKEENDKLRMTLKHLEDKIIQFLKKLDILEERNE